MSHGKRIPNLFGRIDPVKLGCLLIISIGLVLTLRLTLETGDRPWFISVLKIDGPSYIKGMTTIAETGDFIDLDDIYHSPGYQIYLGALKILFPFDRGFFFSIKLLSGFLFLLTVFLTIVIGERSIHKYAGWIAGAILAFSLRMQVYCNLLQGEILQAFCFTLLVLLVILWNPSRRNIFGVLQQLIISLLAIFLVFQQVRFVPLIPMLFLYICRKEISRKTLSTVFPRVMRTAFLFLAPCLLIIGFWSRLHSREEGEFVLIGTGSEFRMQVAYNPNATGASYPYPEIGEPTGMDFVLSHPGRVAWLLRERFLYLCNWKRDIWDLGNPIDLHRTLKIAPSSWEIPIHVGGTLLFISGAVLRFVRKPRSKERNSDGLLYIWILAVVLAPLLVFGSSRFLIPALPAVALFQAYTISLLLSRVPGRKGLPRIGLPIQN